MTPRQTDVLVIGGGPVGACAALELARAGAEVVLAEREERALPAGERRSRQLRPDRAERRAAPGRARRAGPGAALAPRQLQPLLHRAAPQPLAAALAVAVQGRVPPRTGRRGACPCCARCTWRAPTCTTSSAGEHGGALALPPERRAAGVRDRGRPARRPSRRPTEPRGLGVRADGAHRRPRSAPASPGSRGQVAGGAASTPRTDTWTRCSSRAPMAALAEAAGASVRPAPRRSALEAGGAGGARVVTTRGRHRRRPGRARRRRLEPRLSPATLGLAPARSSRPRATASTWTAPPTSPSCPSTSARRTWC